MLRRLLPPRFALLRPRTRQASSARPSSYLSALRQRYPSADPPSLLISFLILHELTAVLPLVALFSAFHALGLGAVIVAYSLQGDERDIDQGTLDREQGRWTTERSKLTIREWVSEGEHKAEKLGRRYGLLGWDKETREERELRKAQDKDTQGGERDLTQESLGVSGDVANAVAAYLTVKALLPLRVLISLRLSPALANTIVKRFKGLRERGARIMLKRTTPS
ncbi:SPOSA6832_04017 [Sporobolomyces salmonicolor]|uniref:SPOSA6832_04017-mRNA-1:cds n=1 Tax=Sporidiobolus salmonicolor TaxID=5005 RepID=A0A0D6EQI9_SPOSA|nr:SPOSA6832_04017 [Sporobolomyces salmonicolor]